MAVRPPPTSALITLVTITILLIVPTLGLGAGPRLAAIDSLWQAGERDSAATITRRWVEETRAAGPSPLLVDLLNRAGQQNRFFGRPVEGERHLREALAAAFSMGDSSRAVAALRWLSLVVGMQGRTEDSRRLCDSLFTLSRSTGDLRHEGWARVGFAWFAIQDGRTEEAIGHYREASSLFERSGELEGEIWALTGLGRAFTSRGEPKGATAAYRRALDLSRKRGDPLGEANAWNDLAAIEYQAGDPSLAREMFSHALVLHRESGAVHGTILPLVNIALCHGVLEEYAQAESVLAEARRICVEREYGDLEIVVEIHAAKLSEQRGLPHESAARYRGLLARPGGLSLRNRAKALIGLADASYQLDSLDAAIDAYREAVSLVAGGEEQELHSIGRLALAEVLHAAGRPEEALRVVTPALEVAARLGQAPQHAEALALTGLALRALGRMEEAQARLLEAAERWETQRGMPLDPAWREQRGVVGQRIYPDLAALLMQGRPGAEGAGAAFDRLQAFKARTLLERILGPGEEGRTSETAPIVGARQLQEGVLRPGELLLDYYLGLDESFLFAMTRADLRVVHLPPVRELEQKLIAYFQIVSTPPATRQVEFDPALLAKAGGRIAQILFGEVEDLITSNRTVLVSGDGMISMLPVEEIHGHLSSRFCETAGAEGPVWVRIPSASVLAELRSRGGDGGGGPDRLLILAGGRTSSGETLRGSLAEARSLGRRYRGASVLMPDASSDSPLDLLAGADLIHIAAHLAIDDASPWRSEIRFHPRGSPINLRASRIASSDLRARMAVLSSCSSAGGRVLSGEGVIGVTSAFLSAGVPSVVATLWPVDDRTTADLMGHFYDRLERGEPAAFALRRAKEAIRSRPETRAPFFWAGFVLVGEGEQRVHLERRAAPWLRWAFVAAFVGLAGGFAGLALRQRRSPLSRQSRFNANRGNSADRV